MRIFLLLLGLLSLPAFAENSGALRALRGDVTVTSAKTGQTLAAQLDQNVWVKDVVTTGPDGRAKVVMDDNSAFAIGPNSKVEIRDYVTLGQNSRSVLIHVPMGKVRINVMQKFQDNKFFISTPVSVCGVRGTDFIMEFDPETHTSSVTTFQGVVEFGKPGLNGEIQNPVKVPAGMNSKVALDGAPTMPSKLGKAVLEKMRKESEMKEEKKVSHDSSSKKKDHNGRR